MNDAVSPIFAHAFGQNFSLPLPIWLFIFGGTSAVLLSFVIISLLYDSRHTPTVPVLRLNLPAARPLVTLTKIAGLGILLLVIAAGLLGNPQSGDNFNVTFCWVIFFVGFTYLTAIFGNLWKAFDPYRTIVELLERVTKQTFNGIATYPKALGFYPALATYFSIVCLELIFSAYGTSPQSLSGLLIFYGFLSVMGCMLFGKSAWFGYMDFFSVFLRLVSKISPLAYRRNHIILRAPFAGLLEIKPENFSLLLFIVFMFASTMFDGFKETRQYLQIHEFLAPYIPAQLSSIAILGGITILVCGFYVLFMALLRMSAKTKLSVQEVCYRFVASLIPIAIGYNIAHYSSYLVTNGQLLIVQVSDPFDRGWNLFGTADYHPNISLLSPHAVWYIQLSAIIIGHIAAVYVAHRIAAGIYRRRSDVIRSQIPLVALMIIYTTISLWIIAQPIYIATATTVSQRVEKAQDNRTSVR